MMNRRQALKTTALALAAVSSARGAEQITTRPSALSAPPPTTPAAPVAVEQGPYILAPLPYPYEALEACIDARTMSIHYGKHHATYVENLNKAVAKFPELGKKSVDELISNLAVVPESIRMAVRNQGGGVANHNLYWQIMAKEPRLHPKDELFGAIQKKFNTFAIFVEQFKATALSVFGSGWAWLVLDEKQELKLETTPNQDSPLMFGRIPLIACDVWEHAYYLKYFNRRNFYLDNFFRVLNWEAVEARYKKFKK